MEYILFGITFVGVHFVSRGLENFLVHQAMKHSLSKQPWKLLYEWLV